MILNNNIVWRGAFLQRIYRTARKKYCKKKIVEVILIETSGGIKGEDLFKVVLLGKPLLSTKKMLSNVPVAMFSDFS